MIDIGALSACSCRTTFLARADTIEKCTHVEEPPRIRVITRSLPTHRSVPIRLWGTSRCGLRLRLWPSLRLWWCLILSLWRWGKTERGREGGARTTASKKTRKHLPRRLFAQRHKGWLLRSLRRARCCTSWCGSQHWRHAAHGNEETEVDCDNGGKTSTARLILTCGDWLWSRARRGCRGWLYTGCSIRDGLSGIHVRGRGHGRWTTLATWMFARRSR